MVERKSDERLLKDGNERLWQLIGQWTQPRAEPSAENESLRDCIHRQKSAQAAEETLLARHIAALAPG
jgi:hypothetical protein